MKLSEKASYLQGLMDGLDIDNTTKEGKVLKQMADIMRELILSMEEIRDEVSELGELCDNIDEDLGALESDFYECYDDDDDDFEEDELEESISFDTDNDAETAAEFASFADVSEIVESVEEVDEVSDDEPDEVIAEEETADDELYEVICPTCNDTICITESILLDGSMECPNCGEFLEFDLGGDEFLTEDAE
ncbi:MAG: hypothetical protein IJO29_04000 [Oscillospiraceae bacterium]|nr:hypothetical protein [Oscillospiraceae bacterium]